MGKIRTHVRWFSPQRPSNASHDTGTTILDRPLEDLTKAELSALAKERGANPWGTKAELLERLSDG